jgi:hypothetical protein
MTHPYRCSSHTAVLTQVIAVFKMPSVVCSYVNVYLMYKVVGDSRVPRCMIKRALETCKLKPLQIAGPRTSRSWLLEIRVAARTVVQWVTTRRALCKMDVFPPSGLLIRSLNRNCIMDHSVVFLVCSGTPVQWSSVSVRQGVTCISKTSSQCPIV